MKEQSHQPLTTAEYETLAAHHVDLRRVQRLGEAAARQVGLTPQLHDLLLAIKGSPRKSSATVAELVLSLQSGYRVVLNWIRRAEHESLLRRECPPGRRRPVTYSLTSKGEDYLAVLAPLHRRQLLELRRNQPEPGQRSAGRAFGRVKRLVRQARPGELPSKLQMLAAYTFAAFLAAVSSLLALTWSPILRPMGLDAITDIEKLALLALLSGLVSWLLPLARRRLTGGSQPQWVGLVPSSVLARYGLALALTPVGVFMAAAFDQVFPGPDFPWVLLVVIGVSAWYGGQGPGSVATMLCLFATVYLFLPPMYDLLVVSQSGASHAIELVVLLSVAAIVVIASERRTRSTMTP